MATSRLYDDDPFIFELADVTTKMLFDQLQVSADAATDLIERGEIYLTQRRRFLTPLLRLRARIDPVAMWKLEGGSKSQ
jgi:hypothetical protein